MNNFELETIKNFIIKNRNGDVVIFEFGSFDGRETITYSQYEFNPIVYGFEPDANNFSNCLKNIGINKNIIMNNYAISNIDGEQEFYTSKMIKDNQITDNGGFAGSLLKHSQFHIENQIPWQKFSDDNPIMVKTKRIETFCIENNISHIDFMHMDVEGAVENVLMGFGKIRPKLIYAEVGWDINWVNGKSKCELEKIFFQMGYENLSDKIGHVSDSDSFYQYINKEK